MSEFRIVKITRTAADERTFDNAQEAQAEMHKLWQADGAQAEYSVAHVTFPLAEDQRHVPTVAETIYWAALIDAKAAGRLLWARSHRDPMNMRRATEAIEVALQQDFTANGIALIEALLTK